MAMRCGGFLLLMWMQAALAQSLDWTGDMTLFGTSADESRPILVMKPLGQDLQGFCELGSGAICTKISTDRGESWSTGDNVSHPGAMLRVCAAADNDYIYAAVFSAEITQKTLYTFPGGVGLWQSAAHTIPAPSRSGYVHAAALATDYAFRPNAPRLFFCWIERDSATSNLSGWFSRSDDHGQTFSSEQQLYSTLPVIDPVQEIGIVAVGNSTEERLVAAATVDRPGSIAEAVTVFISDDLGATWSAGVVIDSLAVPQRELGIAAYGSTVMLVYARRLNAAAERDVFFTYSPDGGTTFSPPQALTEGYDDDYRPSVVIHNNGTEFSVFYLTNDEVHETATVWMRTGSMDRPWEMGAPIRVCEAENAQASGGLTVCANDAGVAAAWTSRFQVGDLDVKFDASWRGTGIAAHSPELTSEFLLEQNYPNPFNGITLLQLVIARSGYAELLVTDILGRVVYSQNMGVLPPGRHQIALNLSMMPSGGYYASIRGYSGMSRRMLLLK